MCTEGGHGGAAGVGECGDLRPLVQQEVPEVTDHHLQLSAGGRVQRELCQELFH